MNDILDVLQEEHKTTILNTIEFDEILYNNLLIAFSAVRRYYKYFYIIQKELGEKANPFKKVFSTLFDLATINNKGETRDMLQFQEFKNFKDDFDYSIIKNYIGKLENELREVTTKNELLEKKQILKLLKNFQNLKASC
jgi:hypothetical protein